MNLKDFLEDCRKQNIIDQLTADRMYDHFLAGDQQRAINAQNRSQLSQNNKNNGLIITVSIIGVLLIGFGIIYLFAHNWDHLARSTKTILSLLPVFLSVLVNIFTVVKRKDNVIWQETAAIFSFLATGSMLALILQVYQLQGIENYFFTYWCILCLPIVYLLRSHSAVFCAIILILLNLTSNPMDQSTLYKIPWFGSLVMFSTLLPYFKRLFTLRQPDSLYVVHQLIVPLVVFLAAIASSSQFDASTWLILFLILSNFHLFGTSTFLRRDDRNPNLMSVVGYIGASLCLSSLLFHEDWGFEKVSEAGPNDYRPYFIPLLFALGIYQLVRHFLKEKITFHNLYKWLILLPLPFAIMNYSGLNALPVYQIALFISACLVIHLSQNKKDLWQLYPALGIITVICISLLTFDVSTSVGFFIIALIPSMYYLVPIPLLPENKTKKMGADLIIIICVQLLLLIVASFEGFWMAMNNESFHTGHTELRIIALVCFGLIVNTIKVHQYLRNHLNGLPAIFCFAAPLTILIGCISNSNIAHFYSILLLIIGIVALILSAKKSNLTVANLALGLIGLVMVCRFFDLKMSLTVKGILFILIGSSFFFANYLILKSRKHENNN